MIPKFQPRYTSAKQNSWSPWYISIPASIHGKRKRVFFRTEDEARSAGDKMRADFIKASDGTSTKRRGTLPVSFPCVYFIRSGEYFKIGYTVSIGERFASHKTSNPNLELLAFIPGTRLLERFLLSKFNHLRHSGEWHRIKGELKTFVESLESITAVLQTS